METVCPKCQKRISGQAFALGKVIRVGDNYYHLFCLQETEVLHPKNNDKDSDGA